MLKDGRLNLGEFMLPVAADKLPQSYSMLAPDVQLPNMKWVDGHKPVFSCSLHTESSVHPQVRFCLFFNGCVLFSSVENVLRVTHKVYLSYRRFPPISFIFYLVV